MGNVAMSFREGISSQITWTKRRGGEANNNQKQSLQYEKHAKQTWRKKKYIF